MLPASKILVGVDGRQGGRDAITLSRHFAAPDAEIVLGHVWSRDVLSGRDRTEEAEALLVREARRAGIHPTLDTVGDSRTAAGMRRLCALHEPDLVVVGASHRSVTGRLLVGDLGRALVHELCCPVAVAPQGTDHEPYALIGVAWDDSDASRGALAAARALAEAAGAELQLFHAVEPPPVAFASPAAPLFVASLSVSEIERAREQTDALGDRPGIVEVGPSVPGLMRLSAEVDLLVIGAGRHGLLHRLVLGSHADIVIHDAKCPVLVVPEAAMKGERTEFDAATQVGPACGGEATGGGS
jgi:nucleotide-binding universal stress UspA family protein